MIFSKASIFSKVLVAFFLVFPLCLHLLFLIIMPPPGPYGLFLESFGGQEYVLHFEELKKSEPILFYSHIASGGLAILFGSIQFIALSNFRRRTHIILGSTYFLFSLWASLTGILLSFNSFGGPFAKLGFLSLGLFWSVFTLLGLRAKYKGDSYSHFCWMLRGLSVGFGASSLRVVFPLAAFCTGSIIIAYDLAAWGSWLANLVLVEVLLRRSRIQKRVAMTKNYS